MRSGRMCVIATWLRPSRRLALPQVLTYQFVTTRHFRLCFIAQPHTQSRQLNCNTLLATRRLSQEKQAETPQDESLNRSLKPNRKTDLLVLAAGMLCVAIWNQWHREEDINKMGPKHEKFVMPHTNNLVLFKRKGHWIPYDFVGSDGQLEKVKQFKVRPSDVFVVSFPKSGTTWVQEVVFQIMNHDKKDVEKSNIDDRFPYLEFVHPGIKELDKLEEQRFMKSHIQFNQLPQAVIEGNAKVIYVARNAKDVAVSMYHFYKLITTASYTGSFDEFCQIFNEGKVAYGPYWKHVSAYWNERERKNVLFIKYEDLHKNVGDEIKKIADFLGKSINDKQALDIAANCAFEKMKHNPHTNYEWYKEFGLLHKSGDFMRKGEVGDWKSHYTSTQAEQADKLTEQHFQQIQLDIPDVV